MTTSNNTRTGCTARYHGTYTAYRKAHCRCPDARKDWRLYTKRRRENRAPTRQFNPTGSARRIQALMAIGHSTPTIGAVTGVDPANLRKIANQNVAFLLNTTVETIKRAYDQLSLTPGTSRKTRNYAATRGWAPPLAWDDDAIDDPNATPTLGAPNDEAPDRVLVRRALNGQARWADLNIPERVEVIRLAHNRTRTSLATSLGVSWGTFRRFADQHAA